MPNPAQQLEAFKPLTASTLEGALQQETLEFKKHLQNTPSPNRNEGWYPVIHRKACSEVREDLTRLGFQESRQIVWGLKSEVEEAGHLFAGVES